MTVVVVVVVVVAVVVNCLTDGQLSLQHSFSLHLTFMVNKVEITTYYAH